MALIKCPDCGHDFSNQSATCPNCGRPNSTKYCKFCGELIDKNCVICPKCGKQVELLETTTDKNIIINNNNSAYANASSQTPIGNGKERNKWVALLLCIFTICGHKFYEGKFLMGLIYLFTCGLFLVGWILDIITLLMKPNPYYV